MILIITVAIANLSTMPDGVVTSARGLRIGTEKVRQNHFTHRHRSAVELGVIDGGVKNERL